MGYVLLGYAWLRIARKAHDLDASEANRGFYQAKLRAAEFYFGQIYPRASAHYAAALAANGTTLEMEAEDWSE
jgi:hypothetical protein